MSPPVLAAPRSLEMSDIQCYSVTDAVRNKGAHKSFFLILIGSSLRNRASNELVNEHTGRTLSRLEMRNSAWDHRN